VSRERPLAADIADGLQHVPVEWATAGFCLAFFGLAAWAFLPRRVAPRFLKAAMAIVFGLGVIAASATLFREIYEVRYPAAVVMKTAPAREGPDERFRTVLELAPGEEVRVMASDTGRQFVAVHLPGGRDGYLPVDAVTRVIDWQD
jgi:hypothetical protein